MNRVNFIVTLQSKYNSLTSKDENTLYFITDSKRIYRGEVDVTESLLVVSSFDETPGADIIEGKLYVNASTLEVRIKHNNTWAILTPGYVSTGTDFDKEENSGKLATIAATKAYVAQQIADITGAYGITFLFALVSSCIAWGIILLKGNFSITYSKDIFCYKNTVLFLASIFTVSLCYGFFKYHEHVQPVKNINTVMVQHNQDTYSANEESSILEAEKLTLEGIDILRSMELKPDLVVWSEGILNRYFPKSQHYYENFPYSSPLMTFIKKHNFPFII